MGDCKKFTDGIGRIIQEARSVYESIESSYADAGKLLLAAIKFRHLLEMVDEHTHTDQPASGSPSDRLAEAFRLIGERDPVIYLWGLEWKVEINSTGRFEAGGGVSIGEAFANLWSKLEGKVDKQIFIKAERLVGDI